MRGITVSLERLLELRNVAQQLQISQQKVTATAQQGGFQSRIRGRGMDFVETRIYQPGDDIRTINWPVTARTGKVHTKIYQQERERPVYIILDCSPSMFFATRNAFKSVIAAQIAAVIAWSAIKNGDRVGGLLIKDRYQILPPYHNKQQLVLLFKHIVDFVAPRTDIQVDLIQPLKQLQRIVKSGSLIYFLSDFYALSDQMCHELQRLARYNEVTNICIYDKLEQALPKNGRYLFHDVSQANSLLIDTHSKDFCAQYQTIFQERLTRLQKLCFGTNMHLIELATHDDYLQIIRQILYRKQH